MMGQRAGEIALYLGAMAFAGLGCFLALNDFGGGPDAPTLEFTASMERARAVRLEGFSAGDAAYLTDAWLARGVRITDSPEAARVVLLRQGEPLSRRVGEGMVTQWPARGVVVVCREDPDLPGELSSFVVAHTGGESDDEVARVVESLARSGPPMRAGVTTSYEGELDGFWPDATGIDTTTEAAQRRILAARDTLAVWVGASDLAAQELRVRLAGESNAASSSARIDAMAWFLPGQGMVVGVGVDGVEDDMVRAYARRVLLEELGSPADTWFADGLVEDLVAATRGPDDVPPRAAPIDVTFEEALGLEPRTLAARRAGVALLARLAAPDPSRRVAVWRDGLSADAIESLRTDWDGARAKAAANSAPAANAEPRRALPRTVAMRLTGGLSRRPGLGSTRLETQLDRIAELGFRAVVLTVHVPIAPPSEDDPRRALELQGWGRTVTADGDAAVLLAAKHARDRGLDVIVWPRFVAGPNGPLGTQQVHPSPAAIEEFGRRHALAVEGVAHLAERAGAAGLVLLEPALLPLPASFSEDVRNARTSLRRQAIAFSRPFRGELIALGRGLPRLERAVQMRELAPDTGVVFGFELGTVGPDVKRPWSAFEGRLRSILGATGGRLRVVDVALDGRDPERRDVLLRAAAQSLGAVAEIDLVIVSHWALDRGEGDPTRHDVSGVSENVLRAIASARR